MLQVLDSYLPMALLFTDVTSSLVYVRRYLVASGMTDLTLQKGEHIRQVGKAPTLTGVWAFEGCSPDPFPLAPYLPQAQQVRYVTSLFPAHVTSPLFSWHIHYTNKTQWKRRENVRKAQGIAQLQLRVV
jgi:hypothetical protein